MRESGSRVVGTFDIHPGMKVPDVGCGKGTTAIPAAQLGADVLGLDIASNLVAAGKARRRRRRAPREDHLRPRLIRLQHRDDADRIPGGIPDYYGPSMIPFEAARKAGREAHLQRELGALFEIQSDSGRHDATSIPGMFLRVTITP